MEKVNVRGYGFCREDLDATWRELEKHLPRRGPDCPETLVLLERALVGPKEQLEEILQKHLAGCVYCHDRFALQRRAVLGEGAVPIVLSPPRQTAEVIGRSLQQWKASRRSGRLVAVKTGGGGGEVEEKRATVSLEVQGGAAKVAPLAAWLHWTRPWQRQEPFWSLSLFLPVKLDGKDINEGVELEKLASAKVALDLKDMEQTEILHFETRLYRLADGGLVSHPQQVPGIADPDQIASIDFTPLRKGSEYRG